MRHSPKTLTLRSVLFYAARLMGALITMELMMHLFWVVAIKDTKAWVGFTPIQIYSVGYLNLKLIWLKVSIIKHKLLIIWRFFRLWAMMDGVETCENMTRCMSNNYSPMEFWRNWHRSYNRWLIRYIYIH